MLNSVSDFVEAATLFNAAGLNVIPVSADKLPLGRKDKDAPKGWRGGWKQYKNELMPVEEFSLRVKDSFGPIKDKRIACLCGPVSGNLEAIDLDDKDVFTQFLAMAKLSIPNWEERLFIYKTPNGHQVMYKVDPDFPIGGNLKLAMLWEEVEGEGHFEWSGQRGGKKYQSTEYNGKWFIAPARIETRGAGGYSLIPTSNGYSVISSDLKSLKPVSEPERLSLLTIARSFDQRPAAKRDQKVETPAAGDELEFAKAKVPTVFDVFNERADFPTLLQEEGWKCSSSAESEGGTATSTNWLRPGVAKGHTGGTLFPDGRFQVYTTSAQPLEEGKQYSAASFVTALRFEGNYKDSARWFTDNGYLPEISKEDLAEIFKENPDEVESSFWRLSHCLSEAEICGAVLAAGLKLPKGKIADRQSFFYDPLAINQTVEDIDKLLASGACDWGYYTLGGGAVVGYVDKGGEFVQYNIDSLEMAINKTATMTKYDGRLKANVGCRVPNSVLKMLLSYPDSTAPELIGFSSHPTLIDGKLAGLNGRGFDRGIMFTSTDTWKVASDLSYKECYDRLVEMFCKDILFKNRELGEALFIASMLTATARGGIKGGCPGVFCVGNEAGTGKSTMFEFISYTVFGKKPLSTTWSTDEDEQNKLLTSQMLLNEEYVLFDNIKQSGVVDSGLLAQAITAGSFRSRLLGGNKSPMLQATRFFAFIGNNINMASELSRRLLTIELSANMRDPARRKVTIHDIEKYCLDNRKEAMSYLLRMLEIGGDMESKIERGSGFSFWDTVVRNPILSAIEIDVAEGFDASKEMSSEVSAMDDLYSLLAKIFGVGEYFYLQDVMTAIKEERAIESSEMAEVAEARKGVEQECRELRDLLTMVRPAAARNNRSLSTAMSEFKNRVGVDYKLVEKRTQSKNSKPKYWIEAVY